MNKTLNKEEALKNYISLVRFIIDSYDKITDRVFQTPCLYYKPGKFKEEKDPFKIILQWNMFYRKNMKYFYNDFVRDGIPLIKKFINKNKLELSNFIDDLNYFESSYKQYDLLYEKISFVNDIDILDVKSTVAETLDIFNAFKNIQFFTCEFTRNLDLKFEKKFYQSQIFHNLSNQIYWHCPDILFSRGIEVSINNYIFEILHND